MEATFEVADGIDFAGACHVLAENMPEGIEFIGANTVGSESDDPEPEDPWGHGRNPLGCCGNRRQHGGPGCRWPGGDPT